MDDETIELFQKSELPKKGWLQCCFHCNAKTSLLTHITTITNYEKKYECFAYICKDCKNIFRNDEIKYYNFIQESKIYINDKYSYLLTS